MLRRKREREREKERKRQLCFYFLNICNVLLYRIAGFRSTSGQGEAARAGGRQAAGADRGADGEGGGQRGRGAQAHTARERRQDLWAGG